MISSKYVKHFTFDIETIRRMGNRCDSKKVEQAILEYAQSPAEYPKKERKNFPMSGIKKNVALTMELSTFELIAKIANGSQTAVVETAVWKYYKEGK